MPHAVVIGLDSLPGIQSARILARRGVPVITLYRDCLNLPLPPSLEQRDIGVKWLHLHYDFRSAWYYWRRGELSLREWGGSWRDPLPFLADVGAAALRGTRHLFHGG